MGQSSRTRLLTAGMLVVVFGAGVALGLVVDSELGAKPAGEVAEATETEGEPEEPRRRRIYEEVGPNESQLELIDSVIREHRARTNALDRELRAEYQDGFRSILLDTREAIKSVLTPEQAAEYQRLLDEYDAERDAERENGDERD